MSIATLTVKHKVFKRTLATWDALFGEAGAFAAQIGRERLIGISHSQHGYEGVVAVWFWDEPGNADDAAHSEVTPRSPPLKGFR